MTWQQLTRIACLLWMSNEVFIQDGQRPYLLTAIVGTMAAVEMYRFDSRKKDE